MLQSFIIILREGFESFLLVAIVLAYLRKTGRKFLAPAVYWAIGVAIATSGALGYLMLVVQRGDETVLHGALGERLGSSVTWFIGNESLREGVFGVLAILMVASLVIYMWRTGPQMKKRMEEKLTEVSSGQTSRKAFWGVFLFVVLMMCREGMETMLLMLQVRGGQILNGTLLGLAAAGLLAWGWARFSHLVNIKRFFQVTGIYLLLFMVQVGIYTFHEFSEAGLFPNSDALHEATEKFSPDGLYGKWFSLIAIGACALWLLGAWIADRLKGTRPAPPNQVRLGQA
ncbi:MAG: FTR1 family protein [Pyrinomonadaceae bacterium]